MQKVPLRRRRAREVAGPEAPPGSYLRFQHDPQFHPKLLGRAKFLVKRYSPVAFVLRVPTQPLHEFHEGDGAPCHFREVREVLVPGSP